MVFTVEDAGRVEPHWRTALHFCLGLKVRQNAHQVALPRIGVPLDDYSLIVFDSGWRAFASCFLGFDPIVTILNHLAAVTVFEVRLVALVLRMPLIVPFLLLSLALDLR